jgi:DNA-binding GntR family transcriptional regulator
VARQAGGLEEEVLDALRAAGRPLTVGELLERLGWRGDSRPVRRALARLVREGVVERIPDYEGRVHRFRVRG